jgi:DNA polymerase epsilon subunit 1
MAEALMKNIIFPNKLVQLEETFYNGHLLESETYIGGRVECMHNGVYRNDLETEFFLDPKAYEDLITKTNDISRFFVQHEMGKNPDDVVNIDAVNSAIISKLSDFAYQKTPRLVCKPLIYHVDVAAMYPNIILTNRLQPVSVVNDKICSSCIFNDKANNCQRTMEWEWKGEYYPLNRGEFERIKLNHKVNPNHTKIEAQVALRKAVREYSMKHYKKSYEHKNEMRKDIVCMRENPFYVDTVRAFRDRRYEFKAKVKVWAKAYQKHKDDPEESKKAWNLMTLYESLQLAHKIILNSFYGYVMRRGSRWYSMEMAAMVTHTGSNIIQNARNLLIKIGKPLELDTDGVWTLLPSGFPETFEFEFKDGSKSTMSFPCTMCNLIIYDPYKNTQYQTAKIGQPMKFNTATEMSIFFEIDGPHKCMVIPAAREEDKVLKKRYAVFDHKGKLSEVKGFEIKRRGELKIIKIFQSEIFSQYLKGSTLKECYEFCAQTCNKWLNILRTQGEGMTEEEILDLIAESKFLSKNITEYDNRRGVALTAAKRMSEILGPEILEGQGLNVKYIMTTKPTGVPLNERSIPTVIFAIKDEPIKLKMLRRWLKDNRLEEADLKSIVDWGYYIERLSNTMQKMVTISAAYQGIENPVPFIQHPKWLEAKIKRDNNTNPQTKLSSFFGAKKVSDIEDIIEERRPPRMANKMDIEKEPAGKKSSAQKELEEYLPQTSYDENFNTWLSEQKKFWRQNRQRRKAGLRESSTSKLPKEINSFFKHTEQQIQRMNWYILAVTAGDGPGEFNLWVSLESGFVPIKVKIDRTFYIHTYTKNTEMPSNFKKSNKVLPREKKNLGLYEVTVSEASFQEKKNVFESYLLNTDFEGIYETNMDLDFKFISKFGMACKVAQGGFRDEQGFYNSKDLASLPYSPKMAAIDKSQLPMIQMVIVPFLTDRIVCILNEKYFRITVILFHQGRFENVGVLKKAILDRLSVSGRKEEYSIEILQEVHKRDSETDVPKQTLTKQIIKNEEIMNKNFMICVVGRYLFSDFFDQISASHPIISITSPEYSNFSAKWSSLDWHVKGLEFIGSVLESMESQISARIDIAEHLNIPLCNLPENWSLFSSDVLYSRLLNKHNMIHWCSSNDFPDLGNGDVGNLPRYP